MIKSVIRKSIAFSSAIVLLMCSLNVNANEITKYEMSEERYICVEGTLNENMSGILVNLWLYKDGKLIAIKQGQTVNGEYEFKIDLGRAASGDYVVRTIAQIEDSDSDTLEYFNFSGEVGAVYEDIFNHKSDSTYLIEKFNGDYKKYIVTTNPKFTSLIENGKTSDIVAFFVKELESQTTFVQDSLVTSLNCVAAVKTLQETQNTEVIVEYFLNQNTEQQQNSRVLLGINGNAVLTQFENNIQNDILDESNEEEKFTKYETRFKEFAENLIAMNNQYLDKEDFIEDVEEVLIITDIKRTRGKDALKKLIEGYADNTGKFDLVTFNDVENDKDEVLKSILLKIEKNEIKTVESVQALLDTKIKKPTEGGNGGGTLGGSSGGGTSSGGKGGTSASGGVTFPTTNFNENEIVKPEVVTFKDMDEYSWAKESVDALVKLGMLNGYSNERFAPKENVTRSQFAKMMCSLFDIQQVTGTTIFSDVPEDAWYSNYVTALYKKGYIKGISDDLFGIEETISRQDAFTIIFRILKDKQIVTDENIEADFDDWNLVNDYAKIPIATLAKMGLVKGNNGNILPNEKMTRAEGAVIMYRIYEEVFK